MPKQSDEANKKKLETERDRLKNELDICANSNTKSHTIKSTVEFVEGKPEWFSQAPPESNQWHAPAHPKGCCTTM